MGRIHVKYEAWFVGDEPDDFEDYWTIDECEGGEAYVADQFLEYAYSNMDGWEWMPKDNEQTIVRVRRSDTNQTKDFTFVLEYDPVFYVSEV